jgi:hypothetical protein
MGKPPRQHSTNRPRNWRSELIPIAACATASVTSSASVAFAGRPRAGTGYSSASLRPLRAPDARKRGGGSRADRRLPRASEYARPPRGARPAFLRRTLGRQQRAGISWASRAPVNTKISGLLRTSVDWKNSTESKRKLAWLSGKAEGEGFEPSTGLTTRNGFRDRRIRPLCHPSGDAVATV